MSDDFREVTKKTIYAEDAINAINNHFGFSVEEEYGSAVQEVLNGLPSAQPERVWTPCDIPPEHHRDVIVRGIEAIGNVTVHNIMQWDVDRWRPENYAPSIIWLDWSEI